MYHPLTTWLAAEVCPEATNPGWLNWLTQPIATVSAALVAVIAAGIAYAGVTKTTRATRRESRRSEKVAVLIEAFTATHELTRGIGRATQAEGGMARAQRVALMDDGPMRELGNKHSIACSKLTFYGFDASAKLMNSFNDSLAEVWRIVRADPESDVDLTKPYADYDELLKEIQKAFRALK